MGNTATIIGAVALATGLVCLLCGFLWGRSNVKSQVEDALDQARVSADAREYALREQLDETMRELVQLRARAEERPRPKEQREPLNLAQVHGSASVGVPAEEHGNTLRTAKKLPEQKQAATTRAIDSTEETIQNLLKSMEEKLKQPAEEPRAVTQTSTPPAAKILAEPQVATLKSAPSAPAKQPAGEPPAASRKIAPPPVKPPAMEPVATPQSTRPKPPESPAIKQPPPVKDEWQDFAASLEALTRRAK